MNSKKLFEILPKSQVLNKELDIELDVFGLAIDSRKVKNGFVFFAVKGNNIDGHEYITSALMNGAIVIISEQEIVGLPDEIIVIQVSDIRKTIALMACSFFDHPSKSLNIVGVTGTNGKTTTAFLLYNLFENLGKKCGLISTISIKYASVEITATHTTPDSIYLNSQLALMKKAACEYVFMEVSSHAIDQRRIVGLDFKVGVFTNLSHDHLNYHGSFKNYLKTKKSFFDQLTSASFAITNIDDKNGSVMVQNTNAVIKKYSLNTLSHYKAKVLETTIDGLQFEINNVPLFSRLAGRYNVYNLLATYAVGDVLGIQKEKLLLGLSALKNVSGRFDLVKSEGSNIYAIVDYAHTPDALKKVLESIHELKHKQSKIITVVGCGGDRDISKRPKMAKISCRYSDLSIFTSDNPRSEQAKDIIDQMIKDLTGQESKKILIIEDRRQAIKAAYEIANNADVILVAGKGHENYQEIDGKKIPFDDKKELLQLME